MTHYMMDLFLKTPLIKLILEPKTYEVGQEKFISVTEYEILKDHVRKKRTRSSLALFIMICTGCRVGACLRNIKIEHIGPIEKHYIY